MSLVYYRLHTISLLILFLSDPFVIFTKFGFVKREVCGLWAGSFLAVDGLLYILIPLITLHVLHTELERRAMYIHVLV